MTIKTLDQLKQEFLETQTGLSLQAVGNDLNELEIKWLQGELTSSSRNLQDMRYELYQTQSAENYAGYLRALGYTGSLETMERDYYNGVVP